MALMLFWLIDPEIRPSRDDFGNPKQSGDLVFRQLPVTQIENRILAPVAPGEDLKLHSKIIRERSCPVRMERIIVDGAKFRFVLPAIDFSLAPGKLGVDEFTQGVPTHPSSATGPATLTVIMSWNCNPVDKVVGRSTVVTVPFTITDRHR